MAVNNALNNSSTVFTVDNLNLDGNTLSSLSGNINLTAAASQTIVAQADGFVLGRSVDGFALEAILENTSNTAGSDILLNIQSGGTSAGDSYLEVSIDGGQSYTMGLDNSASDAFVLSRGGSLGSNNVLSVNSSTGAVTLNSAYTMPTSDGTSSQVLQTNGSGSVSWQTATTQNATYTSVVNSQSPYTVLSTDYYIGANVTSGVITLRLPNAPTTGRIFVVKDSVGLSATSNITITTVGGAVNIDGATSYVMNTNYQALQLIFNGTSYELY